MVVPSGSSGADAETYFRLTEAFKALRSLEDQDIPVTVHSAVTSRRQGLTTEGHFRIDSTLGRGSLFGIVVDDTVNHYIESVSFVDSGGQAYGPYSSFTNDFNVINLKTINFPQDSAAPPFDDVSSCASRVPMNQGFPLLPS